MVYVHGLWMIGLEGELLRRRLRRSLAASAPRFHYRSISANLAANAERLASLITKLDVDTLHLVGHSLGGLVILKMFEQQAVAALPSGRVVLLGSPVAGSRAARSFAAWRSGKRILGLSAIDGLLPFAVPCWQQRRELGVLAGNQDFGIGRLVNTHAGENDGTVYVDETRIVGMKEHLVVPVNHFGLPFSSTVADLTASFLTDGRFRAVSV